jgi:hypothetical protein
MNNKRMEIMKGASENIFYKIVLPISKTNSG